MKLIHFEPTAHVSRWPPRPVKEEDDFLQLSSGIPRMESWWTAAWLHLTLPVPLGTAEVVTQLRLEDECPGSVGAGHTI